MTTNNNSLIKRNNNLVLYISSSSDSLQPLRYASPRSLIVSCRIWFHSSCLVIIDSAIKLELARILWYKMSHACSMRFASGQFIASVSTTSSTRCNHALGHRTQLSHMVKMYCEDIPCVTVSVHSWIQLKKLCTTVDLIMESSPKPTFFERSVKCSPDWLYTAPRPPNFYNCSLVSFM